MDGLPRALRRPQARTSAWPPRCWASSTGPRAATASSSGTRSRNPQDLKGKIILTSSNTPYSFFLLWYLAQNGLTGKDVKVVWVDDGDKALKLFKSDTPTSPPGSRGRPIINDCRRFQVAQLRAGHAASDQLQGRQPAHRRRLHRPLGPPPGQARDDAGLPRGHDGGLPGDRQVDLQRDGRILQAGDRRGSQVDAGRRPCRELSRRTRCSSTETTQSARTRSSSSPRSTTSS